MKKFALIAVGVMLMLFAQSASAQPEASVLVHKAVNNIRNHKNFEIVFNYYLDPGTDVIVTKTGQAWFQGDAYKIIMEEQHTISDGTTLWSYLVDDGEVMVGNTSDEPDSTPFKLLTTLDKDYTATYLPPSTKDESVVELTNPDGPYKSIKLYINNKTNMVRAIVIRHEDSDPFIIQIDEWKFDQDYKDGFFTFDKESYPGVEIIDMR